MKTHSESPAHDKSARETDRTRGSLWRRHTQKAGRTAPIRTVRPARSGRRSDFDQNVSFQLLIRPVSCAATSCTRSFQVPLATSLEAFTVYVVRTLSAESEELEDFSR